jgi:hypothetical protein
MRAFWNLVIASLLSINNLTHGVNISSEHTIGGHVMHWYDNFFYWIDPKSHVGIYDNSNPESPKLIDTFRVTSQMCNKPVYLMYSSYLVHGHWAFAYVEQCGLYVADLYGSSKFKMVDHLPYPDANLFSFKASENVLVVIYEINSQKNAYMDIYELDKVNQKIRLASQTKIGVARGSGEMSIADNVLSISGGMQLYDITDLERPKLVNRPFQGEVVSLGPYLIKLGHKNLSTFSLSSPFRLNRIDRIDLAYNGYSKAFHKNKFIIGINENNTLLKVPMEVQGDGKIKAYFENAIEDDRKFVNYEGIYVDHQGLFHQMNTSDGRYKKYALTDDGRIDEQSDFRTIRYSQTAWADDVYGGSGPFITHAKVADLSIRAEPIIELGSPSFKMTAEDGMLYVVYVQGEKYFLEAFDVSNKKNVVSKNKIEIPQFRAITDIKDVKVIGDLIVFRAIVLEAGNGFQLGFWAYNKHSLQKVEQLPKKSSRHEEDTNFVPIHDCAIIASPNQDGTYYTMYETHPIKGFIPIESPFLNFTAEQRVLASSFFYQGHYYIHVSEDARKKSQVLKVLKVAGEMRLIAVYDLPYRDGITLSVVHNGHVFMYRRDAAFYNPVHDQEILAFDLSTFTKVMHHKTDLIIRPFQSLNISHNNQVFWAAGDWLFFQSQEDRFHVLTLDW